MATRNGIGQQSRVCQVLRVECVTSDSGNMLGAATGWTARVRFPAVEDVSLLHVVQTGSGAHPVSYPVGTEGSFPGCKAAGA
jgi:hypothetical protein